MNPNRPYTEVRYIKKRGNTLFIPFGWRVICCFAGSGDYYAISKTFY